MPRRRGRKGGGHGENNSERWLITYADLLTLLMIFFVIMYAMSKIDATKFVSLSQSLASALHQSDNEIAMNAGKAGLVLPSNPQDQGTTARDQTKNALKVNQDKQLDNLYAEVKAYITQRHLDGNVSVLNEQRGVQITLRDVVLFDSGEATIKPNAANILKGLVPFFTKVDNDIVVEGYTDNVPITTSQYPTNWDLSAARAVGVVRFIGGNGVQPDRLSAVGYGEYHPVAPNDSDAHRAQNRRVNIVILRNLPASLMSPDNNNPVPVNGVDLINGINAISGIQTGLTGASNTATSH